MNRFQKIVLAGALLNVIVLALFPPHDVESLARGTPVFDAFYPVFAAPPNGVVNANLLYLALFGVFANAAAAWLLLASGADGRLRFDPGNVVVVMAFVNLMIVFAFPPFEAVPVSGRLGGGGFDGFYFAFGAEARRRVFLPLLTIEALFALLNACAFWLALRERSPQAVIDDSIGALISEDQNRSAEIEERVRLGVEEKIKEEAKAAGRAAARRKE